MPIFLNNGCYYSHQALVDYDALDKSKINLFFIRRAGDKRYNDIDDSRDKLLTIELVFIAQFCNIKDFCIAEKAIYQCLESHECIKVKSSSDVSENIYKSEFKKKYQDCETQFVKIEFDFQIIVDMCYYKKDCNPCLELSH